MNALFINTRNKIEDCALYTRLSKEDKYSYDESLSIANQRDLLIKYVEERGWNITEIYADDGLTGGNTDRKDFQRMMIDIEIGKISCVIVKDLSRFGRGTLYDSYIYDYFPERDIRFVAIGDDVDSAKGIDEMSISMRNMCNGFYIHDTSKKVKYVKSMAAKDGKYVGSRPPYGYKRSPDDKHRLIIDEEVAPIVERIFKDYSEGINARQIGIALNEEGIMSPRAYYYHKKGKENPIADESMTWSSNTILQMIKNQMYVGDMVQGKRVNLSVRTKKRKAVPRDQWHIVPNTHEPLVDRDLWKSLQKESRKSVTTSRKTKGSSDNIFGSVVRCADCGSKMSFYNQYSKQGYRCTRYATHGADICTRHWVKLDTLKSVVLQNLTYYAKRLRDDDWIIDHLVAINTKYKNETIREQTKRLNQVITRQNAVSEKTNKLFEEKISGNVPENVFRNLMNGFEVELDEIKKEHDQLRQKILEMKAATSDISSWVDDFKRHCDITKLDREVISKFIEYIEIGESDENGQQTINVQYTFFNEIPTQAESRQKENKDTVNILVSANTL